MKRNLFLEKGNDDSVDDRNADGVDGNDTLHLNNTNDEPPSDSEIQFQPNTSPFLQPIDSNIDIRLFADETANAN